MKKISEREQQLILWASKGLSDKQIAEQLSLSFHTVNTYWARLRQKYGVRTRTAVVFQALNQELESTNKKLRSESNRRRELEKLLQQKDSDSKN